MTTNICPQTTWPFLPLMCRASLSQTCLITHAGDYRTVPICCKSRDRLQSESTCWADKSNHIVPEVHVSRQARRSWSRANWVTGKELESRIRTKVLCKHMICLLAQTNNNFYDFVYSTPFRHQNRATEIDKHLMWIFFFFPSDVHRRTCLWLLDFHTRPLLSHHLIALAEHYVTNQHMTNNWNRECLNKSALAWLGQHFDGK